MATSCILCGRPLPDGSPGAACEACADSEEEITEETAPPPVSEGFARGPLLLRCQGRTWRVAGLGQLKRWIVQHRVTAWDLLSEDGIRWEPVDRWEPLQDLLRVAERLHGPARPAGDARLVDASAPEAGWSASFEPEGAEPPPRERLHHE